ncbi:MAG TPA: hypothetical protein VKV17_11280 [Bryobacteraceae bacterium]|nr:hypothetical protein [Bryobacteraceae bacterium]
MKRNLNEAGARHSTADLGMIQDIHDSAGFLGADCVGNKVEAARLQERGARHSAADMQHVQMIHDKAGALGASCSDAAEAGVLRQNDSLDGRRADIQRALVAKLCSGGYAGSDVAWPWIRDVFDDQVVYCFGGSIYACNYSIDSAGNATVGDPTEVEVAYVPKVGYETEAVRTKLALARGVLLLERDIPKSERDEMNASDFAGKGESFPIKTPEDVAAAAKSIGRAGKDNYDTGTIKRNIIRIAKRKGKAFVAQLPDAWKDDGDVGGGNASKNEALRETIRHEDGQWVVYDDDTGEEIDRFDTREEAEECAEENEVSVAAEAGRILAATDEELAAIYEDSAAAMKAWATRRAGGGGGGNQDEDKAALRAKAAKLDAKAEAASAKAWRTGKGSDHEAAIRAHEEAADAHFAAGNKAAAMAHGEQQNLHWMANRGFIDAKGAPSAKAAANAKSQAAGARRALAGAINKQNKIADIAAAPPKGYDKKVWADVVIKGQHANYAGAVAHYKARMAKGKESALDDMTELTELTESAPIPTAGLPAAMIRLSEAAVVKDGKVRVRIITPGWGSSGYYSEAVLKRDGAAAFPAGTQMFWNHQTPAEEAARPEGNLDNLAAVTTKAAEWDPVKKGLYAEAKVFSDYASKIEEKGPYIGVSIRARGVAKPGHAEGRSGPIVERLVSGKSIDYVTRAGARGGLELQESSRIHGTAANLSRNPNQGASMTEQEQIEFDQLRESAAAANNKVARLMERELVRAARSFAQALVEKSHLPDVAKRRLVDNLAKNPPATAEGELNEAAFKARVEKAIADETAFFAEALGSGTIRNLGAPFAAEIKEENLESLLESELRKMLPEKQAKLAARGRV